MPSARFLSAALLLAVAVAGCAGTQIRFEQPNDSSGQIGLSTELLKDPEASATARLRPVGGGSVDGAVRFLQYGKSVVVRVKIEGLPPHRSVGLHIHEGHGCETAEAGTGGHFNPGNSPHGQPGSSSAHAGDLPNLRADGDGVAAYSTDTTALSVAPGPKSVVGRVVVVSSNADDFKTQPDGNSGKPLACGFVRIDGRPFGTPPG